MHKHTKIFLIAAVLCLAVWASWPEPAATVMAKELMAAREESPRRASRLSGTLVGASPQLNSPFGIGAPKPPDPTETEASIRRVFKAAGFRTPDRYYAMGLKELSALAVKGDIYANIQLGTKYLYSRSALEYDPDYDFSVNPRAEAFAAFRRVAMMGNSPAMAMLATALSDVDPVEAYAWRELAGGTSDIHREFYRDYRRNLDLTNDQLVNARLRTKQIESDLAAISPPKLPPE